MTALNKQALREAVEKETGAHDRLSVMPADDIFDISLHEGTQLDADITDLNAFNEAANPATVLALLDELEAAEKRIAELEARTVSVKLPEPIGPEAAPAHYWGGCESMAYADGYNKSTLDAKNLCAAAGIKLEVGE